jgi:phage terminase large subunit-like protein
MTRPEMIAVLDDLMRVTEEQRLIILRSLPRPLVRALRDEWWWQAHGGQIEPEAAPDGLPWRIWTILAARSFGKTRAGAEWVWARARENPGARIALVGITIEEVEKEMIRGESGLLAIARAGERPRWMASDRTLYFPSGAQAYPYGAYQPERLRGPQHHHAWCDELAKWPSAKGEIAFNNLMLGLRLGEKPRTIVTTTPQPGPLIRRVLALPRCAITRGRLEDNLHTSTDYKQAMKQMFEGTRLAPAELEGILLEDYEGALWTRDLIEAARVPAPAPDARWRRIVIGLDPPASTHGDSCGIVVCALDEERIAAVVADLTASGLSPEAWARRVVDAADLYGASRVVAEKNQGGDMIASVLRAVDANLPLRLVHAGPSKATRAEPIALRFETGRARLAGHFPELEDQLCALTWSGYQGPASPDRADAMVWAMTELFEKEKAPPRIRAL